MKPTRKKLSDGRETVDLAAVFDNEAEQYGTASPDSMGQPTPLASGKPTEEVGVRLVTFSIGRSLKSLIEPAGDEPLEYDEGSYEDDEDSEDEMNRSSTVAEKPKARKSLAEIFDEEGTKIIG